MNLNVFGASGPTGLQVVGQALAAGLRVTAVTRDPGAYPLRSPLLDVVAADVRDPDAVDRAVAGAEAVISTYGVPYGVKPVTVYSHGIANIIRAMTRHAAPRLVCVSCTGVSTREAPDETLLWRKLLFPFFRHVLGRTVYGDMRRMEGIVRESGLDWTIVRPAALFDIAAPTDDYAVGIGRLPGRLTARADLAATLIREATQLRHSRHTIEVITRSGLPSNLTILKSIFLPTGRKSSPYRHRPRTELT